MAIEQINLPNESLERVMGIEPTYSAWEADVLPLNYTRKYVGFRQILPFPIVGRHNTFLLITRRVVADRMNASVVRRAFSPY